MITLYTWTTPNGRKISIALEEMGLEYEVKPVNIGKAEQDAADFRAISPNGKIPAIVDHDAPGGPITLFESGAILIHLAERTGKFLPASGKPRAATLEWLFWQVAGVGPMFGQLGYFAMRAPEKIPPAIDRFRDETLRLLGVMDKRLQAAPYLGGEYSIADMATYPWIKAASTLMQPLLGEEFAKFTAVERWLKDVGNRPAVLAGMAVPNV
jgi:GSH-dependent disulfide-bond oxidoreductase